MSTLKRFTIILFAIVVLTACSVAPQTPPTMTPTATPVPTDPIDDLPTPVPTAVLADVATNREKWESQHITHYRFELHVSCFCAFRDQMPLTIEVKDGKVVSMIDSKGQPVTQFGDLFDTYNTIEKLFAKLDAALNGEADSTTVEYDSAKGYPTSIYIDYIQQAADDEIGFTVSNLTVLE